MSPNNGMAFVFSGNLDAVYPGPSYQLKPNAPAAPSMAAAAGPNIEGQHINMPGDMPATSPGMATGSIPSTLAGLAGVGAVNTVNQGGPFAQFNQPTLAHGRMAPTAGSYSLSGSPTETVGIAQNSGFFPSRTEQLPQQQQWQQLQQQQQLQRQQLQQQQLQQQQLHLQQMTWAAQSAPRAGPPLSIPQNIPQQGSQSAGTTGGGVGLGVSWNADPGAFNLPLFFSVPSPINQPTPHSTTSATPGTGAFPTFPTTAPTATRPPLTPDTPSQAFPASFMPTTSNISTNSTSTAQSYAQSQNSLLIGIPTVPAAFSPIASRHSPQHQHATDTDVLMQAAPFSEQRVQQLVRQNSSFSVTASTRIQGMASQQDADNNMLSPGRMAGGLAPQGLRRLSIATSEYSNTFDSPSPLSSASAVNPHGAFNSAPATSVMANVAQFSNMGQSTHAHASGPSAMMNRFNASGLRRRHSDEVADTGASPAQAATHISRRRRTSQRACVSCYFANRTCSQGNPCDRCRNSEANYPECVNSRFDEQNIFIDCLPDDLKQIVNAIIAQTELFHRRADQALAIYQRRPIDLKRPLEIISVHKFGHKHGYDAFFEGSSLRHDTIFGPFYQANVLLQARDGFQRLDDGKFTYTEQFENDLFVIRAISAARGLQYIEHNMEKNKREVEVKRASPRARNLLVFLAHMLEQTLCFEKVLPKVGAEGSTVVKIVQSKPTHAMSDSFRAKYQELAFHLAYRTRFMANYAYKSSGLAENVVIVKHDNKDVKGGLSIGDEFWSLLHRLAQDARILDLRQAQALAAAAAPTTMNGSSAVAPGLIITAPTLMPDGSVPRLSNRPGLSGAQQRSRRKRGKQQNTPVRNDDRDRADAGGLVEVRACVKDKNFEQDLAGMLKDVHISEIRRAAEEPALPTTMDPSAAWLPVNNERALEEMFGSRSVGVGEHAHMNATAPAGEVGLTVPTPSVPGTAEATASGITRTLASMPGHGGVGATSLDDFDPLEILGLSNVPPHAFDANAVASANAATATALPTNLPTTLSMMLPMTQSVDNSLFAGTLGNAYPDTTFADDFAVQAHFFQTQDTMPVEDVFNNMFAMGQHDADGYTSIVYDSDAASPSSFFENVENGALEDNAEVSGDGGPSAVGAAAAEAVGASALIQQLSKGRERMRNAARMFRSTSECGN